MSANTLNSPYQNDLLSLAASCDVIYLCTKFVFENLIHCQFYQNDVVDF